MRIPHFARSSNGVQVVASASPHWRIYKLDETDRTITTLNSKPPVH